MFWRMRRLAWDFVARQCDKYQPIGTSSANSAKSVESDHGCTSRIYFDNAGDNLTPTLYNVTLTSQKSC